jgi:hypothetical protein
MNQIGMRGVMSVSYALPELKKLGGEIRFFCYVGYVLSWNSLSTDDMYKKLC